MAQSCLSVMNAIEAMKPSSTEFTWATRASWCDEICGNIYRDLGVDKVVDYRLTTTLKAIDLSTMSTQIRIDNVQNLWVTSVKTTASSNCTSTTLWDDYAIGDIEDYKNPNTVNFGSYFADERIVRVKYRAIPALFPTSSTDSTSIPDIDQEALDVVKYGVLAILCKAGDAPDVELANAYTNDFESGYRKVKATIKNRSRRTRPQAVSYKEWTW